MPLAIEYRPTDQLTPYAKNSRTHTREQVAMIASSIREFGFTNPVLCDASGEIVAGHGRVQAAKLAGLETVPVIVLDHMTPEQRRAYVIADNRLAEQGAGAGWDLDLLKSEMDAVLADGFLIESTGFTTETLAGLLGSVGGGGAAGNTDPDDVPPEMARAVSEDGDVWVLGKHRIICGDATRADVVDSLLHEVKPHLMVTDPPYGVEYDPDWRSNKTDPATGKPRGAKGRGKVDNDDKADWREAWALFPGEVAYVWHGMRAAGQVFASLEAVDFEVRAEIVWVKKNLILSRGHYHPQHESCFYAVKRKGKSTAHWAGDRKQSTVWDIAGVKSDLGHGTQKPVLCMQRAIENNSSPGQAVYEPFSGSGTTIIACEVTGRICYAVELNPVYVDVAVRRWAEFTGQQPVHEATGKTFAEMKVERRVEDPAHP